MSTFKHTDAFTNKFMAIHEQEYKMSISSHTVMSFIYFWHDKGPK